MSPYEILGVDYWGLKYKYERVRILPVSLRFTFIEIKATGGTPGCVHVKIEHIPPSSKKTDLSALI